MYQFSAAIAAAKSLQSCPTLCDPIDGSPPGSHVPGILQGRTLEWVAISFSNLLDDSNVWHSLLQKLANALASQQSNQWGPRSCVSRSAVSDSLRPHGLQPTRLLCPWDSPGKNTGVDCLSLLQGIFPTQGLNPGLPHCRQILYQLSHQGSPHPLIILSGHRDLLLKLYQKGR